MVTTGYEITHTSVYRQKLCINIT